MRKTFKLFCAAALSLLAVSSCYDDSSLWNEFDNVHGEIKDLKARVEKLEKDLKADVENLTALQGKVNTMETTLTQAIADGDAAVKKALEDALASAKAALEKAVADGDAAVAASLQAEVAKIEAAMDALEGTMNDAVAEATAKLQELAGSLANVQAELLAAIAAGDEQVVAALEAEKAKIEEALKAVNETIKTSQATVAEKITALEALVGAKYEDVLAKMDAADKVIDGKIADVNAAVEAVKKAYTEADQEILEAFAEALASVAVQDVEEVDGKIILTLADGSVIAVSKPLENVGNGIVTTIDVNGVLCWAVITEDGEVESLDVPVGAADVDIEFSVAEDGELLYMLNGLDWISTGAYVAADAESLIDFYQGETDEMDWETYEYVKEDFYTLVFGGETYYLPLYKVDNSVVSLKAGKTYFEYGKSVTVDVVLSDITSIYVMTKPDGWRASLQGKKLTVTAPAEEAVEAGYAEADGEVLLHCTTTEGKCKIAKLAVATTPGFSLTVTEDGALTIVNPEVVTQTDRWGETLTDFNDAYVGLAPVAAFEADPVAYVENIDNNWDDKWYYLSNWKMNSAEYDDDWNVIYSIGGAYVPGEYEVDVIETTVPEMYADWTYGDEIPATPFVVWACPMDENGMPRINDLVYAYYYPSIKATITEVEASTTDVEVEVAVVGATEYYVGLVTEEMLYGFPIDTYMQMQEGPFGYFQMALQYGMPDYAFQQMGTPFGGEFGEEMPETITASMLHYGEPLMPNTTFYMWVFPVVEGLDLADYTYEKNMKPYIYEFTTEGLSAGGSATVEFGEANLSFTLMNVEVASEGATMIYYNWFDVDTYNEFADDAAISEALLAEGYVLGGDMGTAVNQEDVTPGAEFFLVALAVDAEGKYGEVTSKLYAAPAIEFSETFKASFGEIESSVYYSGYRYNFPITVEGGEAAKYYYVWSTTEYTDEDLANLPLTYDYDYNFRSITNVAAGQLAGQYANASSTYYLAVVVESTTGELSPVIKMTVEVPAVPETEE